MGCMVEDASSAPKHGLSLHEFFVWIETFKICGPRILSVYKDRECVVC